MQMKKIKTPADSETIMTEVVFSSDTNPIGIVQGGRIIQLMDIACAVSAQTHSGKIAVTVSIDSVSFKKPARLGDILTIKAKITRVFNTSMEIYAEVSAKRLPEMTPFSTNDAYFTFVVLDDKAKPVSIAPLRPVSVFEKKQYKAALERKKRRTKEK
jgi:acyl-CoA hydrolase